MVGNGWTVSRLVSTSGLSSRLVGAPFLNLRGAVYMAAAVGWLEKNHGWQWLDRFSPQVSTSGLRNHSSRLVGAPVLNL